MDRSPGVKPHIWTAGPRPSSRGSRLLSGLTPCYSKRLTTTRGGKPPLRRPVDRTLGEARTSRRRRTKSVPGRPCRPGPAAHSSPRDPRSCVLPWSRRRVSRVPDPEGTPKAPLIPTVSTRTITQRRPRTGRPLRGTIRRWLRRAASSSRLRRRLGFSGVAETAEAGPLAGVPRIQVSPAAERRIRCSAPLAPAAT